MKKFLIVCLCLLSWQNSFAQSARRLYVVAGQSNAVGQGDSLKSVDCALLPCYEYDVCLKKVKALKDPMGQKWRLTEPAGTGTIGPAFAKRMYELTKNEIYMVSAARGGASCHRKAWLSTYNTWDVEGGLFDDAVAKIDAAVEATNTTLSGIIWMQGERDANAILDKQLTAMEYKDALKDVILRFRKKYGTDLPFYIVLIGYQQDRESDGCSAVRKMQREVADEMTQVYIVFSDTDKFPKRGWFKDRVHYNQDGLNTIGQEIAEKIVLLNKELSPFAFSEVKLLDSWIKRRQDSNIDYIKRLDAERLLHNFRVNAGIASNAAPLDGWEHPQIGLRGHFTGHYLSALSSLVAQTGDTELRKKLDYMASSLAECQRKLGGKYLSAFPMTDFDILEEKYGGVWAPYYTYHKILQGMLDAYQYGGNQQALEVAKNMADFVEQRMDKLTAEQIERILYTRAANPTNEVGGMNDALYELFRLTRENRYFKLASLFDREWFKKPLANGIDQLSGLHANTHIVLVNGFARCHELTHDKDSRKAVVNFYRMLENHHSYINGTSSGPRPIPTTPTAVSAEHWGDTDVLAFTDKIAESCVTHNAQKLTAHLFEWTASSVYADDFMNRYYNAVLPAKHSETSQTLYHLPLSSGSTKKFLKENDFRCCNGTGIEAYSQLTSGIYYHRGDELWVNNYVPSALSWYEEGFELEQHGDITKDEEVLLTIISAPSNAVSIHCLIPHWVANGSCVSINGKDIPLSGRGEFCTMKRRWKKGDEVRILLKSDFRIEHLSGKNDVVAIYYGPSLLAFSAADEVILKGTEQEILNALSKKNIGFEMTNGGRTYELLPFFDVDEQPYACYVTIRNY